MYRIVITSHYDKDKYLKTKIEVQACISHLATINRTFDIYKDNVLIATGSKEGIKKINNKKHWVIGPVKYERAI